MAPCIGTTSTPPNLVVPNHSTLQWHPMMAPSNGTTSTAPCNGTLVPRPIRQSGSSPSSPIGSKNPYSYPYLGNESYMNHIRWNISCSGNMTLMNTYESKSSQTTWYFWWACMITTKRWVSSGVYIYQSISISIKQTWNPQTSLPICEEQSSQQKDHQP